MDAALTEGHLLDGRVRYAQPRVGYRSGIEPVLLAASVPARPGDRVLEAGSGAGAGLLCLAARVPGITGVGVERDPAMAAIARHNFAQNGFRGLAVWTIDLLAVAEPAGFDHVFANPPWHGENSTASQVPGRDQAKRARAGLLEAWIAALSTAVKPGGSISLVLPAPQSGVACAGFAAAGAGGIKLFPLWPREGIAAKLALVAATKGDRGAAEVLAGLVLHRGTEYTPECRRILRGGEALALI